MSYNQLLFRVLEPQFYGIGDVNNYQYSGVVVTRTLQLLIVLYFQRILEWVVVFALDCPVDANRIAVVLTRGAASSRCYGLEIGVAEVFFLMIRIYIPLTL